MRLTATSQRRLRECHPKLQKLMEEVSDRASIYVLCGFRGEKEQNEAFDKGASKLKFPDSKHNKTPSLAVDIAPNPLLWDDIEGFKKLGDLVKRVAKELDIQVKWGGDWVSFKDYPHFELT
jgi:peptidoglycan L-alanyl-D-glutamate endopeptidase CwlK